MNKKIKAILLFGLFFLLTFAIVLQSRVIDNTDITWLSSYESDDLIDEIFKWKNKYDEAIKKLDEQKEVINDYTNNGSDKSETLDNEIENANILVGKTEVSR